MSILYRLVVRCALLPTLIALWLFRSAEAATGLLAQGVKVSEGGGKNYFVEIPVTVALIGLALWIICKSSRRV